MTSKLEIGDKAYRRNSSDKQPKWIEFTVNKTYLKLIKEFPEDYRPLNHVEPMAYMRAKEIYDSLEEVVTNKVLRKECSRIAIIQIIGAVAGCGGCGGRFSGIPPFWEEVLNQIKKNF